MCKFFSATAWSSTNGASAFYGISLNNPVILSTIGFSGGPTVYKILLNTAIGNLIIVLAGALPGYWVTVATVDILGRKTIQLGGFIILVCSLHYLDSHITNIACRPSSSVFSDSPTTTSLITASSPSMFLSSSSATSDPTPPPSSSPESAFPLDTVQPPTVSLPPPARSVPSLRKPPLHLSVFAVPSRVLLAVPLPHGCPTSLRSSRSSCSSVSSPLSASRKRLVKPLRNSTAKNRPLWKSLLLKLRLRTRSRDFRLKSQRGIFMAIFSFSRALMID